MLQLTDAAYHPRTQPVFNQLRRAAVSVEANIVEGFALQAPRLFSRHIRIALGSLAEVECLVVIAHELDYLRDEAVGRLQQRLANTFSLIIGLRRSIARQAGVE
ncbi:MAG: four helix bundle protein [Gemmatimonadetes bacterium]|nr:four helix bundle protein [Gemmatimonadota bacterium]